MNFGIIAAFAVLLAVAMSHAAETDAKIAYLETENTRLRAECVIRIPQSVLPHTTKD